MGLRDWSALRVLLGALGWVILVLVFALPRVLRLLSGGVADGQDGVGGVSFGPKAMFLVFLVTVLPPLAFVTIWLWQRGR
jgi:hypothetical protein